MVRVSFLKFIDLRFLLPPLINLFLYYFLSSRPEGLLPYWIDHYLNARQSIFIIVALLIFVLVISFIIFTSITIPFALTLDNRLSLQLGHFSFPWTAAFIASFILSPAAFFYVVFPMTILLSLSQELILNLLMRFFGWLLRTLRRFPGVDVICVLNGQYHGEDGTLPPPQFESPEIEINSARDQPNWEHELEITVD